MASSGDVTFTKPGWVELPAEIILSKDETSVTLELISLEDNYAGDGRGDFAIDDISFQVCAPPAVDVTPNLSEAELLDLCTDKEFILTAKITDAVKQYYKDINYLFQWTKDDPSVVDKPEWHDLGSPSTSDAYTFVSPANEEPFLSIKNQPKTNFFFRLVVGDKVTLTTDRDWEDMNAQSPCRNVSISDIPIIASLNCAKCYTPEKVEITEASDPANKAKQKLTLCEGDKLSLSADASATDDEGNPYNGYYLFWQKDGNDIAGYSKLELYSGGKGVPAKDLEIVNDGSYTTETTVEYSVVAVDTFEFKDLASASCKEVAKVEVTFLSARERLTRSQARA